MRKCRLLAGVFAIVLVVSNLSSISCFAENTLNHNDADHVSAFESVISSEETPISLDTDGHFDFNIETAGKYRISLEYKSVSRDGNDAIVGLSVDDRSDICELKLPRYWTVGKTKKDSTGNDMRGECSLSDEWYSYTVCDYTGSFLESVAFDFSAGTHTLKLLGKDGDILIRNIRISAYESTISYDSYLKEYSGTKTYSGKALVYETEEASLVNSRALITNNDMTSSLTTPYSATKTLLNVMGGNNWKTVGQKIEWKINAPENALYRINLRYLQSYFQGYTAYRALYINGEIPFKEASNLPFVYGDDWQTLSSEYYVFLKKGENTVSLECVLGNSADLLQETNSIINELNALYRNLLMIVGSAPDSYRDYHLERNIPGLKDTLNNLSQRLEKLEAKVMKDTYSNKGQTSSLKDTARQLKDMADSIRSITKGSRIDRLKSNISSIASFANNLRGVPLQLDRFVLTGEDSVDLHSESFAGAVKHSVKRFIASFTEDYMSNGKEFSNVTVWLAAGRDQLQILKSMVESDFVPKNNINVDVQLVTGSVIQAFLAGKGPDIALTRSETDVINFAIRNALVDLSTLDGFDEIKKEFSSNALLPFTYKKGVYALPDQQQMDMMFVRTDILKELKIEVPDTWEQLKKETIPMLQRNNLSVGLGILNKSATINSSNLFYTLLYQNGGSLYNKKLTATNMNNAVALQAFDDAISFYREYGVPQEYDFLNRFRTGENPVIIAPYINYNMIKAGAPELDDLWEMYPIPGTVRENGEINRAQLMTSTGCVMFTKVKDQQSAWTFLKWFVSSDTQRTYGIDLESVLGASGRYPTANIMALNGLGWSRRQLDMLTEQRAESCSFVQIPGGYYTAKEINNAIVVSATDTTVIPREKLIESLELIDNELRRKQKEFS